MINVSIPEAGQGLYSLGAPTSLPPLGGQMGVVGLDPTLRLGLRERQENQDLLVHVDSKTVIIPLQRAVLKSSFLYTINKLPQSQRMTRSLKIPPNKKPYPQ